MLAWLCLDKETVTAAVDSLLKPMADPRVVFPKFFVCQCWQLTWSWYQCKSRSPADHSRAQARKLGPPDISHRAAGSVRAGAQLIPSLVYVCLSALWQSQLLHTSAKPLPSNLVETEQLLCPLPSPSGSVAAPRKWSIRARGRQKDSKWEVYTRELQWISSIFIFLPSVLPAISARVCRT